MISIYFKGVSLTVYILFIKFRQISVHKYGRLKLKMCVHRGFAGKPEGQVQRLSWLNDQPATHTTHPPRTSNDTGPITAKIGT